MKAQNEQLLRNKIEEAEKYGASVFKLDGNDYKICCGYRWDEQKSQHYPYFELYDETVEDGRACVCSFAGNYANLIYFIKKLSKKEVE